MSGEENLSGQQFGRLFHGSVNDLKGDHLVPGGYGGASGGQDEWKHLGQSKNDYVSATDDESTAWLFAARASSQGFHRSRQRVYEVEPHPDTKIGIEHIDHPTLKRAYEEQWWKKPQPAGEHIAPSFKVIAQHDTRPGAQGTFPSINWEQFARKDHVGPVNHPHNAAPQYNEHFHEAYHYQNEHYTTPARRAKFYAKRNPTPTDPRDVLF